VARLNSGHKLEPYTTVLSVGLRDTVKDLAYEIRKSGKVEPKAAEIVRAALTCFFKLPKKNQFELVDLEINANRAK
jgi:hypothetical protein